MGDTLTSDTMASPTVVVLLDMPAAVSLTLKDLPKASARGPPKKLKNPLKPSPPTPTVATVSSVKLFGDSPGPRGPLNPNLSMVTTDTDSTILLLCAIWQVVLPHPGLATSYTQRSPQGLRGKRSAEAEPYYGYLHQQAWPSVRAPGFSATTYGARPYGYY